jgi:hypothetical protein
VIDCAGAAACVTSAAALTSTAIMTGGGSQASQTPSATATLNASGNMSLPGTLAVTGHVTLEGVTSTGASGSGLLVFNNGPTFITPALGTPASGTATNETGYLLNNISGATAAGTITEAAANDAVTFAGVETAALHYPYVFQNTVTGGVGNPGVVAIYNAGTNTHQVDLEIVSATGGQGFLLLNTGGAISNGVVSGGSTAFAIPNAGSGGCAIGAISFLGGQSVINLGVPGEIVGTTGSHNAAIVGTSLLASVPCTAATTYRLDFYAIITTAATTSSILGGTTGLTVSYTDATTGAANTCQMPLFLGSTGVMVTTGNGVTTNAIGNFVQGSCVFSAKNATAITYSYGYTSVGGTAMVYETSTTLWQY